MALSINPYKHENQNPLKMLVWCSLLINERFWGNWRQEDPWGFLVGHSSVTGEL